MSSQISIEMTIDSKVLVDCINLTKQVEEKSIRQIVAWIKQQKEEKVGNSDLRIADDFTKKNIKTDIIQAVTTIGDVNIGGEMRRDGIENNMP